MSSDSQEARTIVVTGGADGIGRAVVLLCAARGDSIAVLDKNAEAAKTTAVEAVKRGAKAALGLSCDVASEEQIEKAFEIIWKKWEPPMVCSPVRLLILEGSYTSFRLRRGAKF